MLTIGLSIAAVLVGSVLVLWLLAYAVLREVPSGQIRLVTWFQGRIRVYRGPAKSKEFPLLSSGMTIPSTPRTAALDLVDQTLDAVAVHASVTALVSIGDPDAMVQTAARSFFTKGAVEQADTLRDLLSSSGARALNLLRHEQLFAAVPAEDATLAEREGHPLAVMIRHVAARELADLGLVLRSLYVKSISSGLVEARRRAVDAEARAGADIAVAQQARRAREAQLESERALSDRERELEQARADNAGLIAQAKARQQTIEAEANAQRVRAEAEAAQEALRGAQFGLALDEALRITKIAAAQADGFRKVNDTIREGGDSYFRYRLIEMLPKLTPAIAQALANANLVSTKGDGAPAALATNGVTEVIQSALAGQLANGEHLVEPPNHRNARGGRVPVRKRQPD
jgi:flotillin